MKYQCSAIFSAEAIILFISPIVISIGLLPWLQLFLLLTKLIYPTSSEEITNPIDTNVNKKVRNHKWWHNTVNTVVQEGNKKEKYPVGNHGESTGLVDSINNGEEDNMKVLTSYAGSARAQGKALYRNPHYQWTDRQLTYHWKHYLHHSVGRG